MVEMGNHQNIYKYGFEKSIFYTISVASNTEVLLVGFQHALLEAWGLHMVWMELMIMATAINVETLTQW
jgi:hypothetical protein